MHDNFPRTFLSVFVTRLTHYKQTSIVNEMSKKENIYFISSARNQIVRGTVIENRELLDKLFCHYPYGYIQRSALLAHDQNIDHRMKIKLIQSL